ncbi:MAG: redox-sensing transcriptional repressor Rex, partial [Ruminococcus sp.]|nr:redox-sensing transcriptional repressor Rex [Ruminococcus sp.]
MAKKGAISAAVVKRLPRYYRFLGELKKQGVERISSGELSRRMQLTASQIRQDLNCFGGFGQQGYGYHVDELREEIGKILGVDRKFSTIIIGAGNLGRAITTHIHFDTRGCELVGIFDKNDSIIGTSVGEGLSVRHIDELDLNDCNLSIMGNFNNFVSFRPILRQLFIKEFVFRKGSPLRC